MSLNKVLKVNKGFAYKVLDMGSITVTSTIKPTTGKIAVSK